MSSSPLSADGRSASRKAVWVVAVAGITSDSIDFHNVKVLDRNGAGIRAEYKTGGLLILNSGFYDIGNGLLSDAGPVSIHIDGCDFASSYAGTSAAPAHKLYIGSISSPNFWPNATLQAQIGLTGVPDAGYTRDAPAPYTLRPLTGSTGKAGALQSAP